MTERDDGPTDADFALAEFVQLHEHIRQQDNAMVQLMTVLLVSSTALVSAVGAYIFQQITASQPLAVPTGYLFLTPIIILVPGLAMLRAHRKNIYRMGMYIKVFLEKSPGGAQWHYGLSEYKSDDEGESLDHVPVTVWMLALLSILLFWMTLVLSRAAIVHWFAPLPLLAALAIGHRDFARAKDPVGPEAAWRTVRAKLEGSPPATPEGGT